MNLQEFNALQAGDKIENPMNGSQGEVVEVKNGAVHICWPPSATTFRYSVEGTAWFHWTKVHMCPDGDTRCSQIGGCGEGVRCLQVQETAA